MIKTQLDIVEREILDKAKKEIKEFSPYEDLNLFTVLGMENKEVTAHSAFLYSIFKPFKQNNSINCSNLKILISTLLKKTSQNICFEDIASASIHREYPTAYGRLDFLVEYTTTDNYKNAIIVELKVWAGEQENQIDRYFEYLDTQSYHKKHVFFLTPTGYTASTDTSHKSIPISLNDDIVKTLNIIIDKTDDRYTNYKSILQQYIQLVKKLTEGDYMGNTLKSKEDIIAVGKLYNERYLVLTELMRKFMRSICDKTKSKLDSDIIDEFYDLESKDFVKYDIDSYYKNNCKSFPRFAFHLNSSRIKKDKFTNIDFKNVDLFFMVEIADRLYCGLTFRQHNKDGAWDWFNLKDYVEGSTSDCWVKDAWKYIQCDYNNIDFNNYENEQTGMLRLLNTDSLEFDEKKLNAIVQEIIGEFNEIVSNYFE